MCGILGFLGQSDSFQTRASDWLLAARHTQRHRGPDSEGHVLLAAQGLGLAHQRLAILDLTPAGHQPMTSACQQWLIVFNGEIYNHLDLRAQLQREGRAPIWRGHSDTETLLAGFAAWGFEPTLQKTVGMFAIAAWHFDSRTLYLARDRFGEKPLYYAHLPGQGFAFASELKALAHGELIPTEIDTAALATYLQLMYVPAPQTIYRQVHKLEPGHWLALNVGKHGLSQPQPRPYWRYADVVEHGTSHLFENEAEAITALNDTLQRAVGEQCLSDVPLGAFLSGGVDSSLITALMQKTRGQSVDTFTVGFDVPGYDESDHALAVATHLGTRHHELRVSAEEARNVIPELPAMYCEPFADSSQIPTHLVCRSARLHATVALSGDAGDELFGGYNRYLWGERIWRRIGPLGRVGRNAGAWAIECLSPAAWDSLLGKRQANADANGVARVGEKLHKLASRMRDCDNLDQFYLNLTREWLNADSLIQQTRMASDTVNAVANSALSKNSPSSLLSPVPHAIANDPIACMMYRDAVGYLPGDILTKVDRAAMAISLETRAPFLDHRVAEVAWRLPAHMKIRNGTGKWALRQILYQHVPRELIERPKAGFAIPLAQWLRGPLRDWAESLLQPVVSGSSPYLQAPLIQRCWQQHQTGSHDHSARLWAVLMFQAWLAQHRAAGPEGL